MHSRWMRGLVTGLAVAGVLGLTALPAEHVHAREAHGQRGDHVHRHFESHAPEADGVHLEQAEGDVHYSNPGAPLPEKPRHVFPDDHVVFVGRSSPEAPRTASRRLANLFVLVHDPPWTSAPSLRGPPSAV